MYGIQLEITGGSLGSYLGLNIWTSDIYTMITTNETPANVENRLVSILTVNRLDLRKCQNSA